jgi:hypothetical protein
MYFGYTIPELLVFGVAAAVIIWALWKILTEEKHSSKFFHWFMIALTCFALWAWRSGNGAAFYNWVKNFIGTPS